MVWRVDGKGQIEELGRNFSSALYRLGEMHRIEELQKEMDRRIAAVQAELGPHEEQAGCVQLAEKFTVLLNQMNRRELRGEMSREDILDRPILRALIRVLGQRGAQPTTSSTGGLYSGLELG